eukprot:Partr_v1_DN27267_c0_g2_i1_m38518
MMSGLQNKATRRYLLVFDLNGTLIDRLTHHDRDKRKIVAASPDSVPHDMSFNRTKVYLRPGVRDFLKAIPDEFAVGLWTSAFARTTMPIIANLFDGMHLERTEFLYFREECDNTRNYRVKNECKDLSKIWNVADTKWSAANTVLIDDSVHKARKQPRNHILIPEFDVSLDLLRQDSHLHSLLEYLVELSRTNPSDIRRYLKERQITFTSSTTN